MPNAKSKPVRRDAFTDLGGAGGAAQFFGPQNPAGVLDLDNARSIDVDLLHSNPFQPRKTFDDAALAELAADIKEHGVLQPLLVRPHPETAGRYQIVAGERRWRAAILAGLAQVPCIERAATDVEMERLALLENIQRADLDPADEAHAYKRLIERGGLSVRDVAASVHKDHSYVAGRLLLIKYREVEEQVRAGAIGPTVATGIARIADDAERDGLVTRVRRGERVGVEDVKRQRAPEPPQAPSPKVGNIPHLAPKDAPAAPTPPLEGRQPALEEIDRGNVDAVLQYGIDHHWTCQELRDALNDQAPDAAR